MSKIAVALTGVSYGLRTNTRAVNTDWNLAKQSIIKNIAQPLISDGHDVGIYMTTYHHDQIQQMIDFYDPIKLLLLRYQGSHQRITYAQSMLQLLYEDVDYILATRFDIDFKKPITSYPIQYDKMNFTFRQIGDWWENHQYVDDNLFLFPKKYLTHVINAIHEFHVKPYMGRTNPDLHPIYKYMVPNIKEENVNFLMEGQHASNDNKFFELVGNGEKYKTLELEDGSIKYTYTYFDKQQSLVLSKVDLENNLKQNNLTMSKLADQVFAYLKSKI